MSKTNILDQTLRESSTQWSIFSGIFGGMTLSEWCILITVIITIANFLKNWYIDFKKLKMLEEEHNIKLSRGTSDE